jgi:hypothetical protein
MKKILFITFVTFASVAVLSSCQETDELPPVADKIASSYRIPYPEPLKQADRNLIKEQEKEYRENATD